MDFQVPGPYLTCSVRRSKRRIKQFRRLMMKPCFFLGVLAVSLIFSAVEIPARPRLLFSGTSDGMGFEVEELARGMGVPWGLAFINASEMIVTEQPGTVFVLETGTGKLDRIADIPGVRYEGQGGLLDVAVPKNFEPGGFVYFTYSKDRHGKGVTALARARYSDRTLQDWADLFVTRSATDKKIHYGSRIAFDNHGHIFFTVGERGVRANAQDLLVHAGSILRLNLDGSVPDDNPFLKADDALPEIWSFGHRNPQGIAYDDETGRLWAIEHGPRGGDEINLIRPGKNYGWPVISFGKEYWGPVQVGEGTSKPGMEQPVKYYDPSIAPGSLLVYSGKAFPRWKGNLFAGALKLRHLNRVVLDREGNAVFEERLFGNLKERIRGLAESPEGWLYFSTDSGRILRLINKREIK